MGEKFGLTAVELEMTPRPSGDVFITGGSGRIGTCLRRRLGLEGYRVRFTDIVAPADGDLEGFTQTDLADQDAMAEAMAGARALIHLAGHPREIDWPVIERLNYTGTYNAFRAAERAGISTVIYASSVHFNGLSPADAALSPLMEPRPTGLYGASKVFGEGLLRAQAEALGLIAFAWRICAFRPAPECARDLRLWLSPDDAARAVDSALRWSEPGFNILWGVSANTRARVDDPVARRIGYVPQDDAERYVKELRARGVDTSVVSEWPLLGGEKASEWMSLRSAPLATDR